MPAFEFIYTIYICFFLWDGETRYGKWEEGIGNLASNSFTTDIPYNK